MVSSRRLGSNILFFVGSGRELVDGTFRGDVVIVLRGGEVIIVLGFNSSGFNLV